MKIKSTTDHLERSASFRQDTLPPPSAETEAYLADMMRRADARQLRGSLYPTGQVSKDKIAIGSKRGKTVSIAGKRGKTLSIKSFGLSEKE